MGVISVHNNQSVSDTYMLIINISLLLWLEIQHQLCDHSVQV